MFECTDLTVIRDGVTLLTPFSISLAPGQIVTLDGPSGLGKSTLLSSFIAPLPGIQRVGRVEMDGRDWADWPVTSARAQMVFQEPSLFPHLSIGANVALGLDGKEPTSVLHARIRGLFDQLGLDYPLSHPATALSRGEAMRVQIARALAPEPKLLLLDEAFTALDAARRSQVRDMVFGWVHSAGSYCVQVTHTEDDRVLGGMHQCLTPKSIAG